MENSGRKSRIWRHKCNKKGGQLGVATCKWKGSSLAYYNGSVSGAERNAGRKSRCETPKSRILNLESRIANLDVCNLQSPHARLSRTRLHQTAPDCTRLHQTAPDCTRPPSSTPLKRSRRDVFCLLCSGLGSGASCDYRSSSHTCQSLTRVPTRRKGPSENAGRRRSSY